VCGDLVVCPDTETCDDGYADACGSCNATCDGPGSGSTCGDGQPCPETEACDDGNTNDCDGCRGDCSRLDDVCGDGILECLENCDGTDLGGMACDDFFPPYDWGTLRCDPGTCNFDFGTCYGGDDCATAGVITDSTSLAHTTSTMTDQYDGDGCGAGELAEQTDGADRAYLIELEAGEYLVAWLYPVGWNAALYLATDCNAIPAACPEGWQRNDDAGGNETLHYAATVDASVYLIVDGVGGDNGDYTLDLYIGTWDLPQSAGDVIITEVMRNPDQVLDGDGEWFEIYNTTALDLILTGMVVDGSGADTPFQIDHPLIIRAGDYLVFGRNATWTANGWVNNMSWMYPGNYGWLSNNPGVAGDRIGLNFGATLLDEVIWFSGWPGPAGYSMELCLNAYDDLLNDLVANWHDATVQWDPGNGSDYGTPGADNIDVGTCP
jgi:cysteine-rich repeat protein